MDTNRESLPVEILQLLFKVQLKVFITLGVSARIRRMHILTRRRGVSNIFVIDLQSCTFLDNLP